MASLQSLPFELFFNTISRLDLKDVTDLGRTSKELYHYCQSAGSKHLIQSDFKFSPEVTSSSLSEDEAISALRKIVKRREAIADARPFSAAIIGLGQYHLYSNKTVWYIRGDELRCLQFTQSPTTELVMSVRELLKATVFAFEGFRQGSLSLLHFQDGVLSCLYEFAVPKAEPNAEDSEYESDDEDEPAKDGWLIAVDVRKNAVVLSQYLDCTTGIFARHTSNYLYCGILVYDDHDERSRWVLYSFCLATGTVLGEYCHLEDINGTDIGSSVCFEIIDNYFYAVSNQTTYRAQEIDWSSFYHCVRFPVPDPRDENVQKTEDRDMWRRQHSEGPLDDRFMSLALTPDEKTGELVIIESRKELFNQQRVAYKTRIIFPTPPEQEDDSETESDGSTATPTTFKISGVTQQEIDAQRLQLLSLTQDRVALALECDNNSPHFLPSQQRRAANVHAQPTEVASSFLKTPVRSYNASSSAFLDLVNELPSSDPTIKQCLRLRACARRPILAPRDEDGIIRLKATESMEDFYRDSSISFWPPQLRRGYQQDDQARELHEILNPPEYHGPVHGTFDDTSLVYAVGKEGTQRAIVFVNFDAALTLPGLKRWKDYQNHIKSGQPHQDNHTVSKSKREYHNLMPGKPNTDDIIAISSDESSTEDDLPQRKKQRSTPPEVQHGGGAAASRKETIDLTTTNNEQHGLFRREPALYLSIGKGFDFSLERKGFY